MDHHPPVSRKEAVYLAGCASLLLCAPLLFGALAGEASAAIAAGWSCLALVGALSLSRRDVRAFRPLIICAAGFAVTLVFAGLSLTDVIPGTAQPIWAQSGLDPAATLDRSETRLEIMKLSGLGMTFLVGWGLGCRDDTASRAFKVATWSGVAFAGIGIVMHLAHFGPKTQPGRLEATLLNPNTAGALCGAVLCLCIGMALGSFRQARQGSDRWWFALAMAGSLVAFSALLLTFSRGALAATALAMAAMLVARAVARRWTAAQMAIGAGAFAAAGVLLLIVNVQLASRLSALGADALLRRYIFDSHWRAFTEAPVLGYGLGGFDTLNRIRLSADNYASLWNIRSAENVYLQWLVEGGVLTALPMFATIGFVVARTATQAVRRRAMLGPLHALLAVDLVFLLHGIVDFALQTYAIAVFWSFLLGLQLSWSARSSRRVAGQ